MESVRLWIRFERLVGVGQFGHGDLWGCHAHQRTGSLLLLGPPRHIEHYYDCGTSGARRGTFSAGQLRLDGSNVRVGAQFHE